MRLYADGALGSRGAALLADYADAPGNRGLDVMSPEAVAAAVVKAFRGGFQVWTHAIGDRANRTTLDAYEKALESVKPGRRAAAHRARSVLAPGDPRRFAKLASSRPSSRRATSTGSGRKRGSGRSA